MCTNVPYSQNHYFNQVIFYKMTNSMHHLAMEKATFDMKKCVLNRTKIRQFVSTDRKLYTILSSCWEPRTRLCDSYGSSSLSDLKQLRPLRALNSLLSGYNDARLCRFGAYMHSFKTLPDIAR